MTCPHCQGHLRALTEHLERWWKCAGWEDERHRHREGCGHLYWHDGPSLLGARDNQRKPLVSGELVGVSEAQALWATNL